MDVQCSSRGSLIEERKEGMVLRFWYPTKASKQANAGIAKAGCHQEDQVRFFAAGWTVPRDGEAAMVAAISGS
jgi:hypothetical protein